MLDRMGRGSSRAAFALKRMRSVTLALVLVAASALGSGGWLVSAQADVNSGALFLRKVPSAILNDQTNSMSVGVDAAGGLHAAFVNFSSDNSGNYHAYYDYCPPAQDCSNAAHWTLVNLLTVAASATIMESTELAVDAQGRPRVIIVTSDNGDPFLDHYLFAACDSGCTSAAHWTHVDVTDITAGVNTFIFQGNKHFFALDPQGRPRFVIDDGSHYDYLFCNSGCTSAASWNSLALHGQSDSGMGYYPPALAFNAAGQPRLLAPVQNTDTFQTNLNYWECSADDCGTNADSWSSVPLISPINPSAAVYSSLRLTHTGQPRFAYYGTPSGSDETLFYYWCAATCTSAANWHFHTVGLAPAADFHTSGQEPDLALDSQDEPRLSLQALDNTLGHGLGYAWCNQACESNSPSWQKELVDPNSQLDADWDRLPPFGCSFTGWIGANRSSLVLDKAGNPRIGYDAEHYSGQCQDPGLTGQDYRSVRFVFFHGNTLPGPYRLYLPLVTK
jgi:hypothetical protein